MFSTRHPKRKERQLAKEKETTTVRVEKGVKKIKKDRPNTLRGSSKRKKERG
jgi:hypothetical protein